MSDYNYNMDGHKTGPIRFYREVMVDSIFRSESTENWVEPWSTSGEYLCMKEHACSFCRSRFYKIFQITRSKLSCSLRSLFHLHQDNLKISLFWPIACPNSNIFPKESITNIGSEFYKWHRQLICEVIKMVWIQT